MASLPAKRCQLSRAFLHVATDFAGPFTAKESYRRKAKCFKIYLCVLVCMAAKTAHLEIVTDLSNEAFMSAFARFAARRGFPSSATSDNGRKFVGAYRELKEMHQFLEDHNSEIFSSLAVQDVTWTFNSPSAPHFGGSFEAGVKSAKRLLKRIIGDMAFTYEELLTVFCRIEATLNS